MKRLILTCVVAFLLASPVLAYKEGPGTNWYYVDASYGGYHNSVPLVIEIDGNQDTGQLFAVGGSITITCDLHSYAAMCAGWGNEAYTDAALTVGGPSGPGSDTAGDYDFDDYECAEVDSIKTLTITYPLTTPGVHTVYMYSYAEAASWWAGVDEDDFVDAELMFVVYDPAGGFVTGGGWIDSPEGAYVPDPSLTGKASFGFVSKYKKGANVPTGNTEFRFKAGDLNFHSSSYQWLVVNQSGTNAQFKGSGTINGEGDYKFMLWAGDGEPDTFRIKIWEENESEVVVYDNGFNQAIGGGSIVIHTN